MSLKVTIIDNETGDAILQKDNVVALVGAITTPEETAEIAHLNCKAGKVMDCVTCVQDAVESIFSTYPDIKEMLPLAKTLKAFKAAAEGDEE